MSTDLFVSTGFVDEGYVAALVAANLHTYWTDFREYRRGRIPPDWTERLNTGSASRVEGATADLQHRSVLLLSSASAGATILTWEASTGEISGNMEVAARVRIITRAADPVSPLVVRAADNQQTYYSARINVATGTLALGKLVNGIFTSLGSVTKNFRLGSHIYLLLSAQGTTISLKGWYDGDTEPAGWDVSVTDSAIATGKPGITVDNPADQVEVAFFSVGMSGVLAPRESAVLLSDPPMDTWISEPDEELEVTARFEFYDPSTDSVREEWVSTHGRPGSPSDFPSSVDMDAVLSSPGALTYRMESDPQQGQLGAAAVPTLDPLKLSNLPLTRGGPGKYDAWPGYSFFGRPIEIRVGRRWLVRPGPYSGDGILNPHRRFEIVGCAIPTVEPAVTTEEVTVQPGPPSRMMQDTVSVYMNKGIPTAVKSLSTSGWLSIPASTSYNLTSFNIYARIYVPVGGIAGTAFATFTWRRDGSSLDQWKIALFHASHATLANQIWFSSQDGTGAFLFSRTFPFSAYYGRFVDLILGIQGSVRWYCIVNGMVMASGPLTADPRTNSGSTINLLRSAVGAEICDHRVEQYVPEEEALSRFSARRDPDMVNISMHRCDDSLGNTVTDYSPLANHGTLQGTDAVDRSWVPSYLGSPELAGVPMPLSAGVVYHLPTQAVDPTREIFRYNDRVKTPGSTLEVRAKGLLLTGGGTNYTEPAAEGVGTADIVGASDQPVTAGLKPSGTPDNPSTHAVQTLRDDLVTRGHLSPASADLDSYAALRALLPFRGGYHYDTPPTLQALHADVLGPLASHYTLDRSGRLSAGCLVPPVNPGPYGQESLLEFLGYPNRGVTVSPAAYLALNNSGTWGLMFWLKIHRLPVDLTAALGTYFPTGMTIVDRVDGAAGYYAGFDGRTGEIVFGAPGITTTTDQSGGTQDAGHHYTRRFYNFQPETWYLVTCNQDGNTRRILIDPLGLSDSISPPFDFTSGTLTVPTNAPLRIGHGPQGSFVGSLAYVAGYSATDTDTQRNHWKAGRPNLAVETTCRFLLPLTDGAGDQPLDTKNTRIGHTTGTRWCPRLAMDFRLAATPSFPGHRRSIPAWRVLSKYKTNYAPISGADVVAGVSASDRIALQQPSLSEDSASTALQSRYLDSREVDLPTDLLSLADADFLSRLVRGRLSVNARLADVQNWYREVLKLGLTDEVYLQDDRFNPTGRPARAATIAQRISDAQNPLGDVGTWG